MHTLPTTLQHKGLAVLAKWSNLPESHELEQSVFFKETAVAVWGYSDYVAQLSLQHPAWLLDLWKSGDIQRIATMNDYQQALHAIVAKNPDLDTLMRDLRYLRHREMVRLVWQRVSAIQNARAIAHLISQFAQVLLSVTIDYLRQCHETVHGAALDKHGQPCSLYVLGLGKLGGYDLNFSSDIDIMFTYFTPHHWQNTRKEWDPNAYFAKLAQTVIKVLSDVTSEGFIFRVDLRLRPFGQSGPVVMSYLAMEQYYQQHGREWERYALIKARIMNDGPVDEKEILQSLLHRFSYRRYVDYSVIEALRKLKSLMDKQVYEQAALEDIKRGRGGLREIEFIIQTFQLLKGGKDRRLQTPSIYKAMTLIEQEGWLSVDQVRQLRDDYDVLRTLEDSLQMIADRQTQHYPSDVLDRERLAWVMGYEQWPQLTEALEQLRTRVSQQFEDLFLIKEQRQQAREIDNTLFSKLWSLRIPIAEWALSVGKEESADWAEVTETIKTFRHSNVVTHLAREARIRLDRLMPIVLSVVLETMDPNLYLQRFLTIISAIVRRSTYLSLLIENSNALFQLIQCCGQSVWMTEQLSQYPILLDSLLDKRLSLLSFDQAGLENRLEQALLATPEEDMEMQLELLRQIKNEYSLQAAMAYLTAQWDDETLSAHLSESAQAFLNVVARLAWQWVKMKYAKDHITTDNLPPWAIVAYGTLGGKEMGFQSDLDLVFLYDNGAGEGLAAAIQQQRAEYAYQWARRVVYCLELKTYNGYLYKVDTQLRPSGQSGLLVSNIAHFETYQLEEAWSWEHQALLRARVVAGASTLVTQFDAIRQQALVRKRDETTLRQEILAMRSRMLSHQNVPAGKFDIKQGAGGLIDIEFMIQFLSLCALTMEIGPWSYTRHSEWLQWLGNLGRMSVDEVQSLLTVYDLYRRRLNQAALQDVPAWVDADQLCDERAMVQRLWQTVMKGT